MSVKLVHTKTKCTPLEMMIQLTQQEKYRCSSRFPGKRGNFDFKVKILLPNMKYGKTSCDCQHTCREALLLLSFFTCRV